MRGALCGLKKGRFEFPLADFTTDGDSGDARARAAAAAAAVTVVVHACVCAPEATHGPGANADARLNELNE